MASPEPSSRAGRRTVRRLWLGVVGYAFSGLGLVARFAFDATDLLLAGPGPLLLFLAVGVVGTLAAVFGGDGRERARRPPGDG